METKDTPRHQIPCPCCAIIYQMCHRRWGSQHNMRGRCLENLSSLSMPKYLSSQFCNAQQLPWSGVAAASVQKFKKLLPACCTLMHCSWGTRLVSTWSIAQRLTTAQDLLGTTALAELRWVVYCFDTTAVHDSVQNILHSFLNIEYSLNIDIIIYCRFYRCSCAFPCGRLCAEYCKAK